MGQWMLRVAVVCLLLTPCGEAVSNDVGDVIGVWRARSRATKRLHFTWTSKVYHFVRPEELFESPEEFAIDESGRARRIVTGYGRRPIDGTLQIEPSTYVYDGAESVTFFLPAKDAKLNFPFASIGDGAIGIGPELYLMPFRLLYFPLQGVAGASKMAAGLTVVKPADLSWSRATADFNGQKCRLYESGGDTFWITEDPARLPVRFTTKRAESDLLLHDVQVEYRSDHETWIPHKWKILWIGIDGETIIESRESVVTTHSVNQPLDSDLFSLKSFPDGTLVYDEVNHVEKIVRAGRSDRILIPGEFTGHNLEMLKNSETPGIRAKSPSASWIWIGNLVLLIGICSVFYYRKSRHKNTTAQ
jgi:hypothetical protein